jgi:UDP-N-acetylglucosamine diphosphorylase / glucose-1-phosphate thymidylyltransferase / UDP-N-acetylgalactosamine diphosphorylase / glucosamine-1-phosphate N-acetyltransferase / galactosamine-1-phosphate N-acetyltransferase
MDRDELKLSTYFPHLDEFAHAALFEGIDTLWDALTRIGPYIDTFIGAVREETPSRELPGTSLHTRSMRLHEKILTAESLVEIEERTLVSGADILLEAGVILEPGAMIKAPAIIGPETEVRQGAYVRGNAVVGAHCTVGHTTEVKNSVFMDHTEAGHFTYVGDSILGCHVNLGAGCKLANLQLRKAKHKLKGEFPSIRLQIGGEKVDTGTPKIGAFVGDHGEIGCNGVTAPAVFLGAHSWVFANTTVLKGFYPERSILR